jgi:hypothetical protein
MHFRVPFAFVLGLSLAACGVTTVVSPSGESGDHSEPVALPTELNAEHVLATAPMVDTARVAGTGTYVAVMGLLNQTAPCFGLSSSATRQGSRVVVRIVVQQVQGTCATFAAGAFEYDVGVKGLPPGTYDVDVVHRVRFNDGRVEESKVGARTVKVR